MLATGLGWISFSARPKLYLVCWMVGGVALLISLIVQHSSLTYSLQQFARGCAKARRAPSCVKSRTRSHPGREEAQANNRDRFTWLFQSAHAAIARSAAGDTYTRQAGAAPRSLRAKEQVLPAFRDGGALDHRVSPWILVQDKQRYEPSVYARH
jgi:hypothetical protein